MLKLYELTSVGSNAAALRFQPTKRPQITNFKAKPKTHLVDQNVKPTGSPTGANADKESGTNPHNRLAAWTSTAEDDIDVDIQAPSVNKTRTPRYKKRKTKEERPVVQNWDDIYDPGRPNVYEDYKNSEEKYRASQAWKDRLYAHRTRRSSSGSSSARRPALSGKSFSKLI